MKNQKKGGITCSSKLHYYYCYCCPKRCNPWMDPRDPHLLTPNPNPPNGEVTAKAKATTVVPPYWQQHQRQASHASIISNGKPPPISLEDHTEEPEGISSPLWAKVVSIESHVLVSGNVPGVGDYVVWICRVETLDVSSVHHCPYCCWNIAF